MADEPSLLVNPLAVLFPAAALGPAAAPELASASAGSRDTPSDDGSSSSSSDEGDGGAPDADPDVPPGWSAWIVHINFGAAPDMASQVRAVLHVPGDAVVRRALGEPMQLHDAVALVARRTSADAFEEQATAVTHSELLAAAAGERGGGASGRASLLSGSAAAAQAVGALLSALAFVGVLCEGEPGSGPAL